MVMISKAHMFRTLIDRAHEIKHDMPWLGHGLANGLGMLISVHDPTLRNLIDERLTSNNPEHQQLARDLQHDLFRLGKGWRPHMAALAAAPVIQPIGLFDFAGVQLLISMGGQERTQPSHPAAGSPAHSSLSMPPHSYRQER
jgi:hypothetical protein